MTTSTAIESAYACKLCNWAINHDGICPRCANRIHVELDDLMELWTLAHGELLPGGGGHGSSSGERTIGVNLQALNFIAGNDILNLLHEWEKMIRAERSLTPPALLKGEGIAKEILKAVRFAQAQIEWLAGTDYIEDFAREVRELHGMGIAASRQFVKKTRKISCPADTREGLPCGNLLILREDDILELFSCRRCGAEWSTYRLIIVALSDPRTEFWLDAEAIATWLHLSPRRIQQIAKEFDIAKRGSLYDLKAILAARASSKE